MANGTATSMTPDHACNGCTSCALRCTAGIKLSEFEYTRIVEELRLGDPGRVRAVLEQQKAQRWCEEVYYEACLFLDTASRLCLIYPARPLVCRLFGRVAHLPCPIERVPADLDAARVLHAYTRQPLRTFQGWMAEHGVFNFDALLGTPYEVPRFEV